MEKEEKREKWRQADQKETIWTEGKTVLRRAEPTDEPPECFGVLDGTRSYPAYLAQIDARELAYISSGGGGGDGSCN